MHTRRPAALLIAAVLSCGVATSSPIRVLPQGERDVTAPIVLPEKEAQALFNDAIQWSRINHLETGGCFRVFHSTGRYVIVVDVVERVEWRRQHRVHLDCKPTDGIWHTHWQTESAEFVGCNMSRAADLYLISPAAALGIVVCGLGKDSVIPYSYHPKTDSLRRELAKNAVFIQWSTEGNRYRCEDEPEASLKRPVINCQQ